MSNTSKISESVLKNIQRQESFIHDFLGRETRVKSQILSRGEKIGRILQFCKNSGQPSELEYVRLKAELDAAEKDLLVREFILF